MNNISFLHILLDIKYLSTILVEYLQSFKNLSILFGHALITGKQAGIVKSCFEGL